MGWHVGSSVQNLVSGSLPNSITHIDIIASLFSEFCEALFKGIAETSSTDLQ